VLAQYIFSSPEAPFRIVRHGHRWRALRDDVEVGRYDLPEEAVRDLRERHPSARLPRRLGDWRFIPDAPLRHLPPPSAAAMARLSAA
jgi:hypothetical protein